MCASFHPREDLVVSASLDQTVRVWDTSGLRRKGMRGAPADADALSFASRINQDVLFGGDTIVKYVLEGHDRGVNWAAFHPTQNLIVSCADDRQVKLWRMNETKAWEMDTLRGHTNNVSCVMFHPKHDLVVSDSEDRSIRVWDVQKRMCVETYRRAADRFWILAVHPEQALIAAGHDSGMLVFKLERERPAYACLGGAQLFYAKDRFLRRAIVGPGGAGDVPLVSLRPRASAGGSTLGSAPRTLIVNPHSPDEVQVLLLSAAEGGSYELYNLALSAEQEPGRGACTAAVFTARAKFAVLDKSRHITVRGLAPGDPGKKIRPPYANADFLFPAATAGRVLVRGEDRVCLFELQSRRVVAEITSIAAKYVVWSTDGNFVALLGKHSACARARARAPPPPPAAQPRRARGHRPSRSSRPPLSPARSRGARRPRPDADLHGVGDGAHQVGVLGRKRRLPVHDAEPHQVLAAAQVGRHGHCAHAGLPRVRRGRALRRPVRVADGH
jgi:coatomer protein complex subunit alpha (xenin)